MQAVTELRNYQALPDEDNDNSILCALQFVCRYMDCKVDNRKIGKVAAVLTSSDVTMSLEQGLSELGVGTSLVSQSSLTKSATELPLLVKGRRGKLSLITSFVKGDRCVVVDIGNKNRTRIERIENIASGAGDIWQLVVDDHHRIDDDNENIADSSSVSQLVADHFSKNRSTVFTIMMAALVTNTLAMAGIVFSMQVYDRVIPAASLPTLYVLFIGVLIAVIFDFIIKTLRVRLSDIFGRILGADASNTAYKKVLGTPFQDIPKNTSRMVNKVRDVDQIKEMVGSSTINLMSDIPFFLLFVFVLWSISGSLALVPFFAVFFIVLPGLILQPQLAKHSKAMMKDSAARNAFLNESMGSVLDIKLLQAEAHYCTKWNQLSNKANTSSIKFRQLVAVLGNWTSTVQMSVFAMVVLFGAPMVINGELSAGALVASSILASRMLSPMGNINQLLSRWQLAKGGSRSFQDISEMSSDTDGEAGKVKLTELTGKIELNRAEFKYRKDDPAALYVEKLKIQPGERIAVMGRSGSGKSTLLLALAGLLPSSNGELNFDDVRLSSLSKNSLRNSVGLISQDSSLFSGTIRDNIVMGDSGYSDGDILNAMDACGVLPMLGRFEKGLEHSVSERGVGLSDGQKRMVIMARLALRNPKVYLLDEPLAHLDETVEKSVLDWLNSLDSDRTVIVTSHKASVLQIVDRVIIINDGRLIIDENKQQAMHKIRQVRDNANSKIN